MRRLSLGFIAVLLAAHVSAAEAPKLELPAPVVAVSPSGVAAAPIPALPDAAGAGSPQAQPAAPPPAFLPPDLKGTGGLFPRLDTLRVQRDERQGEQLARRAFDGSADVAYSREPAAPDDQERAAVLARLIPRAAALIEKKHVDAPARSSLLRLALRGLLAQSGQAAHPAAGRLNRALLGLAKASTDAPLDFSLEYDAGLGMIRVTDVKAGSAAQRAGLRPGDLVYRMGPNSTAHMRSAQEVIDAFRQGAPLVSERVENSKLTIVEVAPPEEKTSALVGFFGEAARQLAGPRAAQALRQAARRMTASLDPFTAALEPAGAQKLENDIAGLAPVIGAKFRFQKGLGLRVQNVTELGPADRAGLKPDDVVVSVNGQAAKIGSIQRALRSKPEEAVTLEVRRDGEEGLLTLSVRGVVQRQPQARGFLMGDAGYIQLSQFSLLSSEDVEGVMRDLKSKGAKRFVLDLRSNPGGYVSEAAKVAALFLPSRSVLQTTDTRAGRQTTVTGFVLGADSSPLAVLVDRRTASAAEALAAALQDHGRAVIVGEPTWGKGLMQRTYLHEDGSAVKITEGRWRAPRGRHFSRARNGLKLIPDVLVENVRGKRGDRVLAAALERIGWIRPTGEAKLVSKPVSP